MFMVDTGAWRGGGGGGGGGARRGGGGEGGVKWSGMKVTTQFHPLPANGATALLHLFSRCGEGQVHFLHYY